MKVTLSREFDFGAAQALTIFPEGHKCRALHGHTFTVRISATGEVNPQTGLFYDHAIIAQEARPVIDLLDHKYLNEIPGLENPTVENLCRWIWVKLEKKLPGLSEITIYETPRAWCTYRGE